MLSRMVFDGRQLQHRRSTATHHRLVVGVVEWRVDLVVCVSDLHVRSSTWALREKLLSREILVDKNGLTDLVRPLIHLPVGGHQFRVGSDLWADLSKWTASTWFG